MSPMKPKEQEKPMTSRDTSDILAYEEEKKEMGNGINIQINTLIDAMMESEPCLFHNTESNLMVNSLDAEGVANFAEPVATNLYVLRGTHPIFSAKTKNQKISS